MLDSNRILKIILYYFEILILLYLNNFRVNSVLQSQYDIDFLTISWIF